MVLMLQGEQGSSHLLQAAMNFISVLMDQHCQELISGLLILVQPASIQSKYSGSAKKTQLENFLIGIDQITERP